MCSTYGWLGALGNQAKLQPDADPALRGPFTTVKHVLQAVSLGPGVQSSRDPSAYVGPQNFKKSTTLGYLDPIGRATGSLVGSRLPVEARKLENDYPPTTNPGEEGEPA